MNSVLTDFHLGTGILKVKVDQELTKIRSRRKEMDLMDNL